MLACKEFACLEHRQMIPCGNFRATTQFATRMLQISLHVPPGVDDVMVIIVVELHIVVVVLIVAMMRAFHGRHGAYVELNLALVSSELTSLIACLLCHDTVLLECAKIFQLHPRLRHRRHRRHRPLCTSEETDPKSCSAPMTSALLS